MEVMGSKDDIENSTFKFFISDLRSEIFEAEKSQPDRICYLAGPIQITMVNLTPDGRSGSKIDGSRRSEGVRRCAAARNHQKQPAKRVVSL